MGDKIGIGDIHLPEQARSAKKLQSLAVSALSTHGDVVADKVLLYGILGILARLEVASEEDASLRKALKDVFPESMEGF